ncbi:MAG: tetratricopeptide repeat protein [Candidatus Latescibacteria bacterium]|nr:tetratricopeptide repeat protein [Candidatus Latescibacterota bacterium]MBT4139199.1 tetratricopeptide repeat protein [Candidatus Latescibacterota bacterium]MBT5829661.1 tetratricopeptide repeat protein [Candidatus Latescibacterota bacterium]
MIWRWCVGLTLLMVGNVQAQFEFEPEALSDSSVVVLAPELQGSVSALEMGDVVGAIVELQDIVRRDATHGQALRLLASAYLKLKDYTQAIATCRQLVGIDSTDTSMRVALGYLYQQLGDLSQAEQYYKEALMLDARVVQAYQGLGWVYLYRGELEKALDMVTETTERAHEYAPNYILMGRTLTAQGFFEDAVIAYNRAFALQSSLRDTYGILLQELRLRHGIKR